jgi:hypothetical protein
MRNEETKTENLLAVVGDGFGDDDAVGRLIQGTIVRCVDGRWATRDGTTFPPDTRLLALATTTALQRFKDQRRVDEIVKRFGEPLPDVDELNAKIPADEWEEGLDGNPRPPWVKQRVVYLLDPRDASTYTYVNSTVGALIAVERLKERVKWMRTLRGERVVPVVKLDAKSMPTKFGQKMRPEFTIIEWRDFGGLQTTATTPPIERLGQAMTPPSTAEELNDVIRF